MVDTARALLDELMGRNRDLGPNAKAKKVNWDDPEFCQYYLVKFCPHDLFVNTRADLGPCPKLHDDEAKRLYDTARPGARKRQYEDDFLRFCNNMINEVDRKIQKGKQRLLLMNMSGGPVYVSKFQEQINNLNARIKKLLNEAEEAGHRGDVDQAQGLMQLCEQLKEEKETLLSQHDANNGGVPSWAQDLNSSEKQMEVCEVCGAFLIVGDAQQRIEDHLTGKQHLGYSRLRKAVEEMHEKRQKEREDEEKRREDERKARTENGLDRRDRRDRERDRSRGKDRDRDRDRGERDKDRDKEREKDRDRDRDRDRNRRRSDHDDRSRHSRESDRREKDHFRNRDYHSSEADRRDRDRKERSKRESESRRRSRSRSRSHSRNRR